MYICADIHWTRSDIHPESRTLSPPEMQVANDRILPHTAMSDLLLVMVMAPRRFFSSVPRPEIPCWRCRVMQSTPSRASHRLRVGPAGSIAGDFQITRPISLDVSSFTSLVSTKFFRSSVIILYGSSIPRLPPDLNFAAAKRISWAFELNA